MKKVLIIIICILLILCVKTKSVNTSATDTTRKIAITFDDGPSKYTDQIIDIFNKYNSKATFFVLGENAIKYPDLLVKMRNTGHEIGNHTFSHQKLNSITKNEAENEILQTQQAVFEIIGEYPTLLRPTYGTLGDTVRSLSNLPIIMWTIDSLDWQSKSPDEIFARSTQNLKSGDILLFHDIYDTTLVAIEKLVPYLINQGYELVTVTELFDSVNLKEGKAYFSKYSCT